MKLYLAAIGLTACGIALYLIGCRVVWELTYRRRLQERIDAICEREEG